MTTLLLAVTLYIIVFGIDYLFYVKQKSRYTYVSWRTYLLFMGAQLIAFFLFYPHFSTHKTFLVTELVFVSIFAGILLFFARQLTTEKVYVCSVAIERTVRCLTPYYVWVKGAEIMFQQMVYMIIAHQLVSLLGASFVLYIVFPVVVTLAHIVITLGCSAAIKKRLTFGIVVLSIPNLYIFTTLDLLWPAVYLHGIFYVVYWLTYADFDSTPSNKNIVDKRG